MARRGLWGEVDALLKRGQVPAIVLPKAARIVGGSGRGPGRPRLSERERRPRMATPSGERLRCQLPGCQNRISKAAEAIVCSERCRTELLAYVTLVKAILEGQLSAREYPGYYRSGRRKSRR